jgi:hypothetical protein
MTNIFDRMVPPTPEAELNKLEANGASSFREPSADAANSSQQTPADVKKATMELLKNGYVDEAQKQEVFRSVIVHERSIAATLEPLDLELRLDTYRGIAFLRVSQASYEATVDDAAWMHPLVRRQRLTLEQSLLVATLRQAFVIHEQESGVGQSVAKIAVGDLLPQYLTYFGDSGSDAKNESRLMTLLDQLKPHGIISEVDEKQEITIRPLIAYLANPESLSALLGVLKEKASTLPEHERSC